MRPLAYIASAAPASSQYHRPSGKSFPTARAPYSCARNCSLWAGRAPRDKAHHVQRRFNLGRPSEATSPVKSEHRRGPRSPHVRLLPKKQRTFNFPQTDNCPRHYTLPRYPHPAPPFTHMRTSDDEQNNPKYFTYPPHGMSDRHVDTNPPPSRAIDDNARHPCGEFKLMSSRQLYKDLRGAYL